MKVGIDRVSKESKQEMGDGGTDVGRGSKG